MDFEVDLRPLKFSLKNLRPLIFLSENLRPLKKHSGRVFPINNVHPLKNVTSNACKARPVLTAIPSLLTSSQNCTLFEKNLIFSL